MDSKAFFIRDGRTTIPVIAIRLNPREIITSPGFSGPMGTFPPLTDDGESQSRVLAAAGYGKSAEEQAKRVMMIHPQIEHFRTDPFGWSRVDLHCAHLWARQNFDDIRDGMTLDVTAWRERMGRGDYGWQNEPAKGAEA